MAYIREECDKLPELSKNMGIDLKAIANDGSLNETIKVGSKPRGAIRTSLRWLY